jgi:hypothetical protein
LGKSYVRLGRYEEMITAGEQAARRMLPVIQEALSESLPPTYESAELPVWDSIAVATS